MRRFGQKTVNGQNVGSFSPTVPFQLEKNLQHAPHLVAAGMPLLLGLSMLGSKYTDCVMKSLCKRSEYARSNAKPRKCWRMIYSEAKIFCNIYRYFGHKTMFNWSQVYSCLFTHLLGFYSVMAKYEETIQWKFLACRIILCSVVSHVTGIQTVVRMFHKKSWMKQTKFEYLKSLILSTHLVT